jgi:hypothetical protein
MRSWYLPSRFSPALIAAASARFVAVSVSLPAIISSSW